MPPYGFSWVDSPRLAALAAPSSVEDLHQLRRSGIDVLISLTEDALPRRWINEAGLLSVHLPVPDMTAPSQAQLDSGMETVASAARSGMGVAVHCAAGKGRTGTLLAAYFVTKGLSASEAIRKVRELRPGSIETAEQVQAVEEYDRRNGTKTV